MLAEGQRRRARGTDVVAAFIEAHGRSRSIWSCAVICAAKFLRATRANAGADMGGH